MADIFDWSFDGSFDDDLKKIEHYRVHPEMLPFVGIHYKENRILFVGESHYVDYSRFTDEEKRYLQNEDVTNWYNQKIPSNFNCDSWFNTRGIVHNYLTDNRSRGHSMFSNPTLAIIEKYNLENVCDSEVFSICAFMNYFQRPATEKGETIVNKELDNEKAYNNFLEVIRVLKPEQIVFLSIKAYNAFNNRITMPSDLPEIVFVFHPTCAHWYKEDGKEKFMEIIKDINTAHLRQWESFDISNLALPNEFIHIGNRSKRFKENVINVRIYSKSDTNELREIIFYSIIDGKKVGIGYTNDYHLLWCWDYDKNESIEKFDNSNESYSNNFKEEFNTFKESVIEVINNI